MRSALLNLNICILGIFTSLVLLFVTASKADEPPFESALLDNLVGTWVLTGTIAGETTVHDIVANWVLGHQYLRIDEVSRETNDLGAPAYEATVFIGWDKPSGRYVCLWLDVTGGGGLANDVFGYAVPEDDRLAFVFGNENGRILNTFFYHKDNDSWTWMINNEKDGEISPFARVHLARE